MDKQKILETVTPEVKKELKSPYSAVLCPPEDLRVVPKGQGAAGSKKFTIYGYVDSQNSYGAMMRTDFEYDVSELSDGTYSVVEGGVGDRTPTARKAQLEKSRAELKAVKKQVEATESTNSFIVGIAIVGIIILFCYMMSHL